LPGSRETGPRREAAPRYRRLATIEVPIALGRYPQQRYALVLAEPETGRFRQIRKHLAHIHHPVIGDCQHGRGDHNRLYKQYFSCHRMLLHAHGACVFAHPVDNRPMALEAPPGRCGWSPGCSRRFGWPRPAGRNKHRQLNCAAC
jgi:tRNA pseudouridine65 synthase